MKSLSFKFANGEASTRDALVDLRLEKNTYSADVRCYLINTESDLSPRQSQCVALLQLFDIRIDYIPGPSNYLADYLSRLPMYLPLCAKCGAQIDPQSETSHEIDSCSMNRSEDFDGRHQKFSLNGG